MKHVKYLVLGAAWGVFVPLIAWTILISVFPGDFEAVRAGDAGVAVEPSWVAYLVVVAAFSALTWLMGTYLDWVSDWAEKRWNG